MLKDYQHLRCMTRYICGSISQQGSALIVALVFLLAMTLIGVTSMQSTTQQESMAGNVRNYNLAFQAAEAALRSAENMLGGRTPQQMNAIPSPPSDATGGGFIALRNQGGDAGAFWMGFFDQNPALPQPVNNINPVNSDNVNILIQPPSYVIEENSTGALIPPCPTAGVRCFRITARGLGGTTDAVAIVQSTYAR